jgi:hypothetical protein
MIAYPICPESVLSGALRPRLGYPSPLRGLACSRSPVDGHLHGGRIRGDKRGTTLF